MSFNRLNYYYREVYLSPAISKITATLDIYLYNSQFIMKY